MDEHGILACSETAYFAYNSTANSDRRSTLTFQNIFEPNDNNTMTYFTSIAPVRNSNLEHSENNGWPIKNGTLLFYIFEERQHNPKAPF